MWHDGQDWASDRIVDAIRALATTDSTDALDRVIRAHVEKTLEMEKDSLVRRVETAAKDVRNLLGGSAALALFTLASRLRRESSAITADDVLREMGGRGNG